MLASILITFVLLPSISLVVFQSFSCNEDTNTLHVDPLVICDSSNEDFNQIRMLGWLGLFLYPFGVPIVFLYLLGSHYGPSYKEMKDSTISVVTGRALMKSKHAADGRRRGATMEMVTSIVSDEMEKEKEDAMMWFELENRAPRYLGALNGEFEPQWWYIPVFEQYRKLAITGATILIGRGEIDQLILGILIAMVAAMVYFATMPYKDFNDDLFSMFAHFQIFLVLLWSLLVKFQKLMETSHQVSVDLGNLEVYEAPTDLLKTSTLGWLLIISNLSVMLVFGFFMALEVKSVNKSVKARKRWDEVKKDAADRGLSEDEVLEELGLELSHVDKESIKKKFRKEVERASGGGRGGGGGEGEGEIELQQMSKKAKKRQTKTNMASKRASVEEFAMENPLAKERPFGGAGAAKEGNLRHVSEADAVDLGAGAEVARSKHQKYKERGEEGEVLPPHIARAKGFNSVAGKKKGKEAQAQTKEAEVEVEWDAVFEETEGQYYYVNRASGESTWVKPDGM